jgi:hypothetical protein
MIAQAMGREHRHELAGGGSSQSGQHHDHAGSGVARYTKSCVIMKAALALAPISELEIRKSNAMRV